MIRFFLAILRFVRSIFVLAILTVFLMVGMAAAGYYFLDYLVEGEVVEVPNLYNMTKTEALETLLASDLFLKLPVETFPSADVPPGIVIEQRPYPGDIVKKRRAVNITISTGAEELMIPALVGQYQEDASIAIRSAGLEVGERALVYHTEFPEGIVMAQDPMPGRRILYGKKVNLLVSQGPEPKGYVMVNLVDIEISQAKDMIRRLPFQLSPADIEFVRVSDPLKWSKIIEQLPKAGTRITEGESIKLKVASSGNDYSAAHVVEAHFPMPPCLNPAALFLLVWDDSAQLFGSPLSIPLQADWNANAIDAWVLVNGDALILLAETLPAAGTHPKIWDSKLAAEPASSKLN